MKHHQRIVANTNMKTNCAVFLAGLLCATPLSAAERLFPADAGFVNVNNPPYNAKGDGVTNDTAAIQAAILSSEELIKRYSASLSNLQSLICKSENYNEMTAPWGLVKQTNRTELRFDGPGNRCADRHSIWGENLHGGSLPEAKASYTSYLWDGKAYYVYCIGRRLSDNPKQDRLTIDQRPVHANPKVFEMLRITLGAELFGCFAACSERLDDILLKARRLSVRAQTERIGGSDCYVLEAETVQGRFVLWLDPQHGWHLAQATMIKKAGDYAGGAQAIRGSFEIREAVKNVRFESIAGVWVPMEADIEIIHKDPSNPEDFRLNTTSKIHHKKTAVQLDPSFKALRAFMPDDVRDGTRVTVRDGTPATPITGKIIGESVRQHFYWQRGKIVPELAPPTQGNQ